jgi:hypothetical protein
MNIEHMIVEIEESVHMAAAGANIGGFPCGVVRGVIYVLI